MAGALPDEGLPETEAPDTTLSDVLSNGAAASSPPDFNEAFGAAVNDRIVRAQNDPSTPMIRPRRDNESDPLPEMTLNGHVSGDRQRARSLYRP